MDWEVIPRKHRSRITSGTDLSVCKDRSLFIQAALHAKLEPAFVVVRDKETKAFGLVKCSEEKPGAYLPNKNHRYVMDVIVEGMKLEPGDELQSREDRGVFILLRKVETAQ